MASEMTQGRLIVTIGDFGVFLMPTRRYHVYYMPTGTFFGHYTHRDTAIEAAKERYKEVQTEVTTRVGLEPTRRVDPFGRFLGTRQSYRGQSFYGEDIKTLPPPDVKAKTIMERLKEGGYL